ncbi:MAG: hypothetical protein OQJ97_09150 [Rhodospirillales bacterium]|nr:hypothetical protein [Rhodospirillales bacterium]
MPVKTYHAEDTQAALLLAQEDFGENVEIISSEPGPGGRGVQVTFGAGDTDEDAFGILGDLEPEATKFCAANSVEEIQQTLIYHGAPRTLTNRILSSAEIIEEDLPTVALAAAFDALLKFEPLPFKRGHKPILLIGPQGSGKSMSATKMACQAVAEGNKAAIIRWSETGAGAGIKVPPLKTASDNLEEIRAVSSLNYALGSANTKALKVIDCEGINPYSKTHLRRLEDLIKSADTLPVLVLASGGEPRECAEIASIFADLGVKYLLTTRLDAARRHGGLLAAADIAGLKICEGSSSNLPSEPMMKMNAVALARLLIANSKGAENGLADPIAAIRGMS